MRGCNTVGGGGGGHAVFVLAVAWGLMQYSQSCFRAVCCAASTISGLFASALLVQHALNEVVMVAAEECMPTLCSPDC